MNTRSNTNEKEKREIEIRNTFIDIKESVKKSKNDQKKKKLQPNLEQVELYKDLLEKYPELKKLDTKEWVKVFKNHVFDVLERGGRQKREDLQNRASFIMKVISNNEKIKRFIFLDGHGRFLTCILEEMQKYPGLSKRIELVCVEMEEDVHNWHQIFYPSSVCCVKGNIYELEKKFYGEENFFYFNFCVIGGKDGFTRFVSFLKTVSFSSQKYCLVSFGTHGFKIKGKNGFNAVELLMKEKENNFKALKVTERKIFVTYFLELQVNKIDYQKKVEKEENNDLIPAVKVKGEYRAYLKGNNDGTYYLYPGGNKKYDSKKNFKVEYVKSSLVAEWSFG